MQDSSCPALLGCQIRSQKFSRTRLSRSMVGFSTHLPLISLIRCFWSHDPDGASPIGLGFSAFARRYSRNHCCFLFLEVLRWFTSLGWLFLPYEFRQQYIGFPHSDIDGSMDECSSPSLFAAFHVLHRLKVPRHSPHALSSLTIKLVHKQFFSDPGQVNGRALQKICMQTRIIDHLFILTIFLQLVDFLHVFSCQTSRYSAFAENKTFCVLQNA